MNTALYINNVEIPLTRGAYKETLSNYDITGQTEAGTNRRDLIRGNILSLSVTLTATDTTKAALEGYNNNASLTIKHYSASAQALVTWTAYMDGLQCNLLIDGYWTCTFNLIDLEQ